MENVMGQRINTTLAARDINQKELSKLVSAEGVKLSEATLSDIINNVDKGYSYKIFVEISKQLNVSADYLFGISDVMTSDKDIKAICEYTGLKERSVTLLHQIKSVTKHNKKISEFVNSVIESLSFLL